MTVAATPALLVRATLAVALGSCARNKALEDEGSNAERRVHERLVAAIVFCVNVDPRNQNFKMWRKKEERMQLVYTEREYMAS